MHVVELWLDWLRDEVNYAETVDRTKISTLFERAVKDYTCKTFNCLLLVYKKYHT